MPENPKDLYSASCNPPRRAKRPSVSTTPLSMPQNPASKPVSILPKKAASKVDASSPDQDQASQPEPTPAKRGRKPGPLSRSAREAQRRLNHSIIEKARRTKINEALATLRQLVPSEPESPPQLATESDQDDDDGDYKPKSDKPTKKPGKKEEKEKEFKLEILVRTVAYMKELIGRVSELEGNMPPNHANNGCPEAQPPQSRKRSRSEMEIEDTQSSLPESNRPRRDSYVRTQEHEVSVLRHSLEGPTLPSISSWLPDSVIDPRLMPSKHTSPIMTSPSYLPSPPSSTHFDPVRPAHVPPSLSLGPVAAASMVSGPTRTLEDESAATLLLQIASSPQFRPIPSQYSSPSSTASPPIVPLGLPGPSKLNFHLDHGHRRTKINPAVAPSHGWPVQAQTPASLLGLTHILHR